MISSVTFIGAGNVATHLAKKLQELKITIKEIWSYHYDNAIKLAEYVNAKPVKDIKDISENELVIISVRDDVARDVIMSLKLKKSILVHTSGSLNNNVFVGKKDFGIFYPMQSFNKNIEKVDWYRIPIFIEGSNDKIRTLLLDLADNCSSNIYEYNDVKRNSLHVAAVFANNFTNYMMILANEICKQQDIDFHILKTLIENTIHKLEIDSPENLQTGPAKRHDEHIIQKQLEFLKDNKEWKEVYEFMTNKIKAKFPQ